MTFNELIESFNKTGMFGQYLILPDNSWIEEDNFREMFEPNYVQNEPYFSLSNNTKTTNGWQTIWDELKKQGILN